MVILKQRKDEYEVRVKSSVHNRYLIERLKVEAREGPGETYCRRHVVAGDGARLVFEATLHEGFDFGSYDRVHVGLFLPGILHPLASIEIMRPDDCPILLSPISRDIELSEITIGGVKIVEAGLGLKKLVIDPNLANETNITGIHPQELGCVRVKMLKRLMKMTTFSLREAELRNENANATWEHDSKRLQKYTGAHQVGLHYYKERGVTHAIRFSGDHIGKAQSIEASRPYEPLQITEDHHHSFVFEFLFRDKEYFDRCHIIQLPPLHKLDWSQLDVTEQKGILKDLQDIHKMKIYEALTAKNGGRPVNSTNLNRKDQPKEWRPWSGMIDCERKETFDRLRKFNEDYYRGKPQRQYESNSGKMVSLTVDEFTTRQPADDDDPFTSHKNISSTASARSQLTPRAAKRKAEWAEDSSPETPSSQIRQELQSDEESPVIVRSRPVKKSVFVLNSSSWAPLPKLTSDENLKKQQEKEEKIRAIERQEARKAAMKLEEEQLVLEEGTEKEEVEATSKEGNVD